MHWIDGRVEEEEEKCKTIMVIKSSNGGRIKAGMGSVHANTALFRPPWLVAFEVRICVCAHCGALFFVILQRD